MSLVAPYRRGLVARRILVLPALFLLLTAMLPWIGSWFEDGRLPANPREAIREIVNSAVILVIGYWVVSLIRREQIYTRRHLEDLEQLTLTDPLTGLGNRRALERDLPLGLRRSERLSEPLALLYLDINEFKQLNDRFGHGFGDETLRTLGAVLRSCSRSGTDVAYRVGGDEFVMTLVTDRTGAELLAHRIERDFRERSPAHSQLSLGIVISDGRVGASALIDQADSRMYRSKLSGAARRLA
ncbi:MAG TPA: GGDEF domain-containing protein [Candidatus Limnocylindria bacterium]|nr:GGDEF domain-containing protein [Candidatus Limnocylindria bacterium]